MPAARGLADRKDADPARIITAMLGHGVDFIVIGGVAALAHGVQRITRDIDFLIEPSKPNCRRAIKALASLEAAEYRPQSKRWVAVSADADPAWLLRAPRFFDSSAGGIDICNAIKGTPPWPSASDGAVGLEAFGKAFRVLSKDALIRSKLAAGRSQDLADVAELNDL